VSLSRTLPVLVEPGLSPEESLARDRFLLDAVVADPARWPAVLRVYDVAGDPVSIGRWQLAPSAGSAGTLMRRHSGGRAAAFGTGFAGVTLVLPRRAALLEPEAATLRRGQVMNRYVRGILRALEREGVAAIYPGQDTITAGRRLLGVVSFAETRTGAVLVEALLATTGDPSTLPQLLDRADRGGVVPIGMLTPADTTSVAAERGAPPMLSQLADWMARGYAEGLGLAPEARTLDADETARVTSLAATAFTDAAWHRMRTPRADLDRRASTRTMLGSLDVHVAVESDGRIRDACIAGDLIAADDTIPALEAGLQGCSPERGAVVAVVTRVLSTPPHFLLGIGPVDTLVDTVMRALG
jgi:lipoate-protein ligase A